MIASTIEGAIAYVIQNYLRNDMISLRDVTVFRSVASSHRLLVGRQSVCPSVHLSASVSLRQSTCPSVFLYIRPCVSPFIPIMSFVLSFECPFVVLSRLFAISTGL